MRCESLEAAPTIIRGSHRLFNNAGVLLALSGVLVGLNFPLSKLAGLQGVSASFWVMLNSLGGSIALLSILLVKQQFRWCRGNEIRYALIAGPITFAAPNMLVFMVVPQVGAGFSSILFALSPVCTFVLYRLLGQAKISTQGGMGIALGLSGAVGISLAQGIMIEGNGLWLFLAASLPVLLAIGNIYRTMDWPTGVGPELLAFWSHLAAFICFLLILISHQGLATIYSQVSTPLALAQLFMGAFTAPVVFRLQRYGGPVMLSQIGYVAAATSLLVASLLLGERYPLLSWLSALLILLGLLFTIRASR